MTDGERFESPETRPNRAYLFFRLRGYCLL